jgi:hypothetical protein
MKSLAEQIACAERELALRVRVYPRWVASNKMKPEKSDHELECMAEIIRTLKRLAPPVPVQGQLYDRGQRGMESSR